MRMDSRPRTMAKRIINQGCIMTTKHAVFILYNLFNCFYFSVFNFNVALF